MKAEGIGLTVVFLKPMITKRILLAALCFTLSVLVLLGYLFWKNASLNTQLAKQKVLLARQVEWMDSLKTSDQVHLMSHTLIQVADELKQSPDRTLREATIAQIAAISYSLKPYLHVEGDTISGKELSPERGQLLLMLSRMPMDSSSFSLIKQKTSFEGADLTGADLSQADLSGVDLRNAELKNANLQKANLIQANLTHASLWGANLNQSRLQGVLATRADFRWAEMNETDLTGANLHEADLTSAKLRKANLHHAHLQWVDFDGAFLNDAVMDSADLFRAGFYRAQLTGANLSASNLTFANLVETSLHGADFTGSNLNDAIISSSAWPEQLQEWDVLGREEIRRIYHVVDHPSDPALYQLKKKPN